jgi:hypothetical protein
MERKLTKETVGALVAKTIMIIPVTRLGADAACNLAAQCGINLDSNVRSDAKPANITFSSQIKCLVQIESPPQTDHWTEPIILKRETSIQLVRQTIRNPAGELGFQLINSCLSAGLDRRQKLRLSLCQKRLG